MVRLKRKSELKSTTSLGREFQTLTTRSLKKSSPYTRNSTLLIQFVLMSSGGDRNIKCEEISGADISSARSDFIAPNQVCV